MLRQFLKQAARNLRRNHTDAEARLWYYMRGRRLAGYKFRRQHPIGPYIVDFVCLERRLVVELDGGQHAEQRSRDDKRTNSLRSRGFQVLRFWDNDVLRDTDPVLSTIMDALAAPSSPTLLPEGEGRGARRSVAPSPVQAGEGERESRHHRAHSNSPSPAAAGEGRGEGIVR